ncbi:MAG: 3-oxoacid CoA-transferase [Dehalococcoidia bacterium]|jgi:3-oxoacid CoA-transferase|nr:3-oxoacid CoA-transferase [Dehalococcoidia bacterium]
MDKSVTDIDQAVSDIQDGATILIGGFGGSGTPFNLLNALIRKGARKLTVVSNSSAQWWPLVESGQVSRIISGFTNNPRRSVVTDTVNKLVLEEKLRVETVPHGTLEERLRAAAMGIAAFFTTAGVGTDIEKGKRKEVFGSQEYLLEHALHADFALVKGWKGDRWGNIVCRLGAGNRNIIMAAAGKTTIAEVEEVVELGTLEPNRIEIPGVFVQRVIRAPKVTVWLHQEAIDKEMPPDKVVRDTLGLSRELIAMRAAQELEDGMVVNLGFGLPTQVCNFIPAGREVILHSQQGTFGYGPIVTDEGMWDIDLVNASGQPVTLVPGASFSDFATSFGMIRGGHLDATVLGAYQVSESGDLANWQLPGKKVGGIGGAMELALGARRVIIVMEHTGPQGEPKIVRECTYPLTARRVVNTIITNLACIEVTPSGLLLKETAPGISVQQVKGLTGPPLLLSPELKEMIL